MDNSLMVDTMAGITGGVASVYVGQPLDTVKVKMQLFPNMYRGMLACLMNTARQQGLRGLYAGIVPALASNCAENAVMFGTYGQCQRLVAGCVNGDVTRLNSSQNAVAGGVASLFTSLVLCPTELVKIRMQGSNDVTETNKKGPSVGRVMKDIWKSDGFAGLFRGLSSTVVRECLGCSLFFGSYEWTRELLKPAGARKEDCDAMATMAAGGVAGLLMWTIVYPVDVVKSRVQMSEKKPGIRLIRDVIRNAGLRGLYCGLWPTLIKTVPVTAVLLFSVEFSKPFFRKQLSGMVNGSPPSSDHSFAKFFSFCDFVSGWAAGVVATFVGHPMDTIRVVQQVTNATAIKATREIYNQDKFVGYFRGMMFPVLTMGVTNSVFFGINGNTLRLMQMYRRNDDYEDVRFCCDVDRSIPYWHTDVFMSACVAGFFYSLINIPNEVVKTILQASSVSDGKQTGNAQSSNPMKITSPVKLIVELYRINGIRSLYRGGMVLMIRDVPSMGIYMLTYEHFCCLMKKLWHDESHTDLKKEPMPRYIQIISGGVAGVASWISVLPFDVIKSKVIVDSLAAEPTYRGTWDCAIKTYREGGAARFFRGFWLLCARAFPVNGITFVVYEMLLEACTERMPTTAAKELEGSKWT